MILAAALWLAAAGPPLELTRPVVDEAGVLGDALEDALSRKIHDHLDESGVAVGVLIVPSLGGATMAQKSDEAQRAFSAGFGRGHSGVVVFLAVQDRMMRILGDPRLKDTFDEHDVERLTEQATASFRGGDVPGGVTTLVDGIIAKTPHAPRDHALVVKVVVAAAGLALALALLAAIVKKRR